MNADPTVVALWRVAGSGFDPTSSDTFEVVSVTVDRVTVPAVRTVDQGAQIYTVVLPPSALREDRDAMASVSYTYRIALYQHGHTLRLGIQRPAKGYTAQLNYSHTGIKYVTTEEFFPAGALVEKVPPELPTRSVTVSTPGWVWPASGVMFGWELEAEDCQTPRRQPTG